MSQPDLRVDASSARIKREVDAGQVELHELHMGRANQNCTGSQSSAHYARLQVEHLRHHNQNVARGAEASIRKLPTNGALRAQPSNA